MKRMFTTFSVTLFTRARFLLTLLPVHAYRYEPGQALAAHYDANQGDSREEMGEMGQTLATVLVYLNDVSGGAPPVCFPLLTYCGHCY